MLFKNIVLTDKLTIVEETTKAHEFGARTFRDKYVLLILHVPVGYKEIPTASIKIYKAVKCTPANKRSPTKYEFISVYSPIRSTTHEEFMSTIDILDVGLQEAFLEMKAHMELNRLIAPGERCNDPIV